MELKSAENYITKINEDTHLFQIPNSLMGISFSLQRINFIEGFSPISLIWSGNYLQPALARNNYDDFYMAYALCNRGVGPTASHPSDAINWQLNPPGVLAQYETIYCNGGSSEPFYYFSDGQAPPPTLPNLAIQLNRNNMSMSVTKLTIFDKNYQYGACVSFTASLEGLKEGAGLGRLLMFYTIRALPLLHG